MTGIVDQQHPHDLIMEAAALYNRPLTSRVGLQLYGGLAGEPALGPVAFPHRLSAMMNPLAPVSHHWLDATHITYGLLTAGMYGSNWKVESSIFNGREPDEERYDLDLAATDSYSGRITFLPTPRWALQLSAGHLEEAEEHETARGDVERVTASAMHHRPFEAAGFMATTFAWGRNQEEGRATHAVLAESSVSLADQHLFFGRVEIAQKTSHDLELARRGGRRVHRRQAASGLFPVPGAGQRLARRFRRQLLSGHSAGRAVAHLRWTRTTWLRRVSHGASRGHGDVRRFAAVGFDLG